MPKFHSLVEVGDILSATIYFVRDEIERNRLIAHRFGRRLKVSETDLADYLARCRGAQIQHRPRKQVQERDARTETKPSWKRTARAYRKPETVAAQW